MMMYSPRSFPYLQHSPPSPRSKSGKMGARTARNTSTPRSVKPAESPSVEKIESVSNTESKPVQAPATMPAQSSPVVIPPRTPSRLAPSTQAMRARGQNVPRSARDPRSHDPSAIPPAVAALLAITAIPKMPPRRTRKHLVERTISMDELIQEWKQDDVEVPASLVGSPMDVLLGRADDSEDEYGSLQSIEQEKNSFITSRSISSDSIATIPPSLDFDDSSFPSHWDTLSPPELVTRKSSGERKERIVSSPPKEDCVLDHPLLHFGPEESEEIIKTDITEIVSSIPQSTDRFKSFKSNLTASLHALKSAAKSFSNFTAPSIPPDNFLTQSLLSPSFTSEMRPKHLESLPSPELRRYLNPQSASISPTELSMHLHDSLTLDADADPYAPMIQMQTYERRSRSPKSRRSRSADAFSEAGRALTNEPTVRQREPRENGDFLRVIVLEMNMRRVGKLDAKAVGRARIWLPPRKMSGSKRPSSNGPGDVPNRWVGITME